MRRSAALDDLEGTSQASELLGRRAGSARGRKGPSVRPTGRYGPDARSCQGATVTSRRCSQSVADDTLRSAGPTSAGGAHLGTQRNGGRVGRELPAHVQLVVLLELPSLLALTRAGEIAERLQLGHARDGRS